MRIVHISDPHFGTEMPAVVDALLSRLKALSADIIVLSGDLTQRARRCQFAAVAAFLNRLAAPKILVVPGNHDIPLFNLFQRFGSPYQNYLAAGFAREAVYVSGAFAIVMFDASSPWRHTRGALDESHVRSVLGQVRIQLPPNGLLVVGVHQPLIVDRQEEMENLLIDSQKFLKLFSEYGVDLVLSGHIHLPLITSSILSGVELNRHFVFSGAGTVVSHRTRAFLPNSFNVIDILPGQAQIAVVQNNFDKVSNTFLALNVQTFSRDDSGWTLCK